MTEYSRDESCSEFVNPKLLEAIRRHGSCDVSVWAATVDQFKAEHPNPVDVGLVIGRFQPAHDGHIYLIRMALAASRNVVIGIGSADVSGTEDNPFSVHQRESILGSTLKEHRLPSDRISIVHLNDTVGDDKRWFSEAMGQTGKVDAVFGNNDWVNRIFRAHGVPAVEIPLLDRDKLQGGSVRRGLVRDGFLPQRSI